MKNIPEMNTQTVKVFLIGISLGILVTYSQMEFVHQSKAVGGIIFKNNKIYNLYEVNGIDVNFHTVGNK